jgi:HlyD family secretion protein
MKVSALGVEEQRVNVIVDFADEAEPAQLGDAYRVEVRIITWREESVLKVPVGALFRRGPDWAVFRVDEGRAREQKVEIGQRNDREAQVLNGLAEGQTVILHPPDTLNDQDRVHVR